MRCAITVQAGMIERNVCLPADQRIEFRIGGSHIDLDDFGTGGFP
jgi:hypothetical protein